MKALNYSAKISLNKKSLFSLCCFAVLVLFVNSALVINHRKPGTAGEKIYYVAANGSDANNGESASTPWKSLGKVNSFQFQPGDQVLFKRGDVWNDALVPASSGTSTSPIVFSAYGTGDDPVISGLVKLTAWVLKNKGIYESDCASCTIDEVNMVTFNGAVQPMGRYPNIDDPNGGYLTIDSHQDNESITSAGLSGSTNWTGAEIVIRKNHWVIDRNKITGQDGNLITYESATKRPAMDQYGFFIQNDPRTLDKVGEWYFNPSTKKMLMFFGKTKPDGVDVEAAIRPVLVELNKKDGITIANISLMGASASAINIDNSDNIKLDHLSINYSGTNGITVKNTVSFSLLNSNVFNTNNNALKGGAQNITISGNYIKNTAVFPGSGLSGDGNYLAIGATGRKQTLIEHNKIDSTGYIPINFSGDAVVKNNVINYFGFIKDDGGGIYTVDHHDYPDPHKVVREITGNLVFNGMGANDGTGNSPPAGFAFIHGIYLDDNSADVNLTGNTVAHINGSGIYLHNTFNVTVKDNVLYDNGEQLLMQYDYAELTNDMAKSNVISDNILAGGNHSKFIVDFRTRLNTVDIEHLGAFDHNSYVRASVVNDVNTVYFLLGVKKAATLSVNDWQANYNKNEASFKKIAASQIRFEYNSSDSPKTISLNGNYSDYKGNKYAETITLEPFSSTILFKGN